jgi:hypothetical protein
MDGLAHLTSNRRPLDRAVREDGFVIVLVLVMIGIGLLAAAAALTATLSTRSHASRDQRVKRALQAADAGIQAELYRVNELDMSTLNLSGGTLNLAQTLHDFLTCPIPQLNAQGQVAGMVFVQAQATTGNACPLASQGGTPNPDSNTEPVGDHSSYEVQFAPGATVNGDFRTFNGKIVSAGYDDNGTNVVVRRVEAILAPVDPWHALEANHDLELDVPTATTFNGTARAGHNLTFVGKGVLGAGTITGTNLSLTGGLTAPTALDYGCTLNRNSVTTVTLGNITQVPPGGNCTTPFFSRPAPQISSTKPDCKPVSGVENCANDSGFGSQYIPATDEIYDTTGAAISFAPGDYVFCGFYTTGPVNVNPTSTQPVRIFIDNPGNGSRCGNNLGALKNPGNFTAQKGAGNVLASTKPSQAQIYVVGNGTNDGTSVTMTESGLALGQAAFVYAPTSKVTVTAAAVAGLGGTLAGGFIGWDLTVNATTITQDLGLLNYPLSSTVAQWHVKQYIECTPQYPLPSPDPTSGC